MNKDKKIKLSFSDEIGYTEFTVDQEWYEQKNLTDAEKIYHLACVDDDSDLSDCTGKYYE